MGKLRKKNVSDFPKATEGISQREKKVPQSPCWRAGTISQFIFFIAAHMQIEMESYR